jgi:tetratricopeptide (TPR) repeat protein
MSRTSLGIAVIICVSCSHGPQLRQITRPWLEVSSAHFALRTDLDEADARRAAGQLEETRSVMLRAGLGQSTDDGAKVRVVAFAERKELASFAGDRSYGSIEGRAQIEQAVGFYSLDPEGRLVSAYAADADAVDDEAFREIVAYAARTALPYLGPPWLHTGFGIYLEGLRLSGDRKRGSAAKASGDVFRLVRGTGWMDVRFALKAALTPKGGREQLPFRNASWLLVSYFRNERDAQLADYVGRLGAGEVPPRAFVAAFHGLAAGNLAPILQKYVDREPEPAAVAAEPYRGPLRAVKLDDAEIHATWAELHQTAAAPLIYPEGKGEQAAALEIEEALRLDPFNVTAQLAGPLRSAPPSETKRGLEELAQKKPGDARVWIGLASLCQPGEDAKRTSFLDRAAAIDPSNPLVDALRAPVLLRRGDVAAALSAVQRALRYGVRDRSTFRMTAILLARSGRCDEAAYAQREAASRVPSRASVGSEKELFDELQTYEDGCAPPPLPAGTAGLSLPIRDPDSCPAMPSYPGGAHAPGTAVELEYTLAEDGHVYAVHAVDPAAPAQVYFAAAEWLRSCAFHPAKTSSGEPVAVQMRTVFRIGK